MDELFQQWIVILTKKGGEIASSAVTQMLDWLRGEDINHPDALKQLANDSTAEAIIEAVNKAALPNASDNARLAHAQSGSIAAAGRIESVASAVDGSLAARDIKTNKLEIGSSGKR